MSTYSSVAALKPTPAFWFFTSATTTLLSKPALSAICLTGSSSALSIIFAPVFSSPSRVSTYLDTAGIALQSATPPPATIPSSTAACVAFSASSILSFLSFSSVSVAAPTLMTATPPANFANLSWHFSLSNSDSDSASCVLIALILESISAFSPAPLTITVLSFSTLTVPA